MNKEFGWRIYTALHCDTFILNATNVAYRCKGCGCQNGSSVAALIKRWSIAQLGRLQNLCSSFLFLRNFSEMLLKSGVGDMFAVDTVLKSD